MQSFEGTGSVFLAVTNLRRDLKGPDSLYLCFPVCSSGQMVRLSETWASLGLPK